LSEVLHSSKILEQNTVVSYDIKVGVKVLCFGF